MAFSFTVLLVRALRHEFVRVARAIIEDSLQQAAGNALAIAGHGATQSKKLPDRYFN
jgi:hypothetical protein